MIARAASRNIIIVICLITLAAAGQTSAGPAPGDRLKPFSLTDNDGSTYSWTPGRVTVFSFCAFWCDTWKEQSRRLADAQDALAGLPVDFVTISVDGRWMERGACTIRGTLLTDVGRGLSKRLGIDRIPYTIVVDADGKVRYATQGIVRTFPVQQAVEDSIGPDRQVEYGAVYLTFDDFPSLVERRSDSSGDTIDDELLDVLRAHRVPAAFFCICSRLAERKAIVLRAVREGHSLEIHSWDHQTSDPQLDRCLRALHSFGVTPELYRPPGSRRCLRIGGALMEVPVVNPYDYSRPGEKEIVRRVLAAVKPGSIILLHAGVSETVSALPGIIESLRSRGFRFLVLHSSVANGRLHLTVPG